MQFFFGPLTRQRQCKVPTWRGVLLMLSLAGAAAAGFGRHLLPALAPTVQVGGGILAVEGWVPDYALAAAAKEFQRGAYHHIYTTGVAVAQGSPLLEFGTHAEIAAAILRRSGMRPEAVVAVPTPRTKRDRTYASAVALRDRLAADGLQPTAVQVVTLGAHARRTRLLYERAFGDSVTVGVVAVPSQDFDPDCWWSSSEGVRVVMAEALAYLYVLIVPGPP